MMDCWREGNCSSRIRFSRNVSEFFPIPFTEKIFDSFQFLLENVHLGTTNFCALPLVLDFADYFGVCYPKLLKSKGTFERLTKGAT